MVTRKTLARSLTALSTGIALGASLAMTLPAQAQIFNLPNRGAPASTASGGTRSACVESAKTLQALIPERSMGLTASATPYFMVYIPQTKAKTMEFVLRDQAETDLYRVTLPVPAKAGIVKLQFPAGQPLPNLEVGKDYHWYLALVCKPDDRREDVFVDAWIQRVSATTVLQGKLNKANLSDRFGIYAKAGLWYEALATLATLRHKNPQDSAVAAQWRELLTSVGLSSMVDEPLVNSATTIGLVQP